MGLRGRVPGGLRPDRLRRRPDRRGGEGRGPEGPHPHRQAPRRLLPVALEAHRALGQEQPLARRQGRRGSRDRRRVPAARARVRRLPLALGPQPPGIRPARVPRLLPRPAPGADDGLRAALRGLVRRGERRRRLLRRRAGEEDDRPADVLRLGEHAADRPRPAARRRDVQRRRPRRALGRQREGHRGRPLVGHPEPRRLRAGRGRRGEAQPRRPAGHALAPRRVRRVDPPRLVLPRGRGREGQDAARAPRPLLQVGGAGRVVPAQCPPGPPRPHPRERRALAPRLPAAARRHLHDRPGARRACERQQRAGRRRPLRRGERARREARHLLDDRRRGDERRSWFSTSADP